MESLVHQPTEQEGEDGASGEGDGEVGGEEAQEQQGEQHGNCAVRALQNPCVTAAPLEPSPSARIGASGQQSQES